MTKIEPMTSDEIVHHIREHLEMYPDQAGELVEGLRLIVEDNRVDEQHSVLSFCTFGLHVWTHSDAEVNSDGELYQVKTCTKCNEQKVRWI